MNRLVLILLVLGCGGESVAPDEPDHTHEPAPPRLQVDIKVWHNEFCVIMWKATANLPQILIHYKVGIGGHNSTRFLHSGTFRGSITVAVARVPGTGNQSTVYVVETDDFRLAASTGTGGECQI